MCMLDRTVRNKATDKTVVEVGWLSQPLVLELSEAVTAVVKNDFCQNNSVLYQKATHLLGNTIGNTK